MLSGASKQRLVRPWGPLMVVLALSLVSAVAAVIVDAKPAFAATPLYLPWPAGERWHVSQGQGGGVSHTGSQYYALDFDFNLDRPVLAAAPGSLDRVERNVTGQTGSGYGNFVSIRHADGTCTFYAHLKYGSVTGKGIGSAIGQGEQIGIVGNTGYTLPIGSGQHLHFQRANCSTYWQSIQFDGFVETGGRVPGYNEWLTSANRATPTWQYTPVSVGVYTDSSKTVGKDASAYRQGETGWWRVVVRNTGTATWTNGGGNPVRLGTWNPQDAASRVASGWLSSNRAANLVEGSVPPGAEGSFEFAIRIPTGVGDFRQDFNLVAEGAAWMNDTGLNISYRVLPSPPTPPRSVSASVATESAVVSFAAPEWDGGAAVSSYRVTSMPGGLTATGAGSPLTVQGLTAGVSYTFVVTATNAAGTSAPSAQSNPIVVTGRPGAPGGLRVERGPLAGQLVVAWDEPSNTGGLPLTGYTVLAGMSPYLLAPVGTTPAGTRTSTHVVQRATMAYVTVAASNSAGAGPRAPTTSILTGSCRVTVGDASIVEGTSTRAKAVFSVRLTEPAAAASSVDYTTADGRAVAGADFTAVAGTLTFAPGEIVKRVAVPIVSDALDEQDEGFELRLSNPTECVLADSSAMGTILDDDGGAPNPAPGPMLTVGDVVVQEGDAGSTAASVTFSLSAASAAPVTVAYATSDGTALAGSDYTPTSGSVTIPPGSKRRTVRVAVAGDTTVEDRERFSLNVLLTSGAVLADDEARITIVTDDFVAIGPPSAPVGVAASPSFTSSNAVGVTWQAPADDGGSPITGYTVRLSGPGFDQQRALGADARATTFEGVPYDATLTVSVSVANIAGTSSASAAVRTGTTARAVNISSASLGRNAVRVSFSLTRSIPGTSCVVILNGAAFGSGCGGGDFGGLAAGTTYSVVVRTSGPSGTFDVGGPAVRTDDPPPPATVTVGKGAPTTVTGCTASVCARLNVSIRNFTPSTRYEVECWDTYGYVGVFYRYAVVTDGGGNNDSAVCVYGYPGQQVWAKVNGVESNRLVW